MMRPDATVQNDYIEAGLAEKHIGDLVDDAYYMDMDDEGAEQIF